MEFLEILKAIVFGIVQGITEWLPVSSTGHMILLDQIMPFNFEKSFVDTFLVVVQLGSILAVVWLYFNRLNPFSAKKTRKMRQATIELWKKIIVACVPAGIVGLLFDDVINANFYNWQTVVVTLIIFGILFIVMEKIVKKPKIVKMSQLSYKTAFLIGAFQVLALIPGTSRSGATILGAVLLGASRVVAAEFSFYLAVPIMFGASFLKLIKAGLGFSVLEWSVLILGMITAFVVSVFAIKFLMNYIKKNDFKVFGYYRIILAVIVFIFFFISYV